MKNSKMLIATGVVLTSLLLNVASPAQACNDKYSLEDSYHQAMRDAVQEDIQYELQQLNLKRYSY
jgi:hypothetical protein